MPARGPGGASYNLFFIYGEVSEKPDELVVPSASLRTASEGVKSA